MNNNMNGMKPNPMDNMNNNMMPNNNIMPNTTGPMNNGEMNNNMGPNVINTTPMDNMNNNMVPNNNMNPNPMDNMNNNMMPNNNMNPNPMGPMNNNMMPNNNMNPNPMGPMNNNMMPNNNMNPNIMNNGIKQGQKFNPLFIAIPAIIIIVAVVAYLLLGNGGNNYKTPIKAYCKGMNNLDIEEIKKALPEEMTESTTYLSTALDYMKEEVEDNNAKWSITCDISDEKEELTDDELEELNESFKDYYDSEREITEAYKVDVDMKMKAVMDGEEKSDTNEITIIVGKIEGKWYYINED